MHDTFSSAEITCRVKHDHSPKMKGERERMIRASEIRMNNQPTVADAEKYLDELKAEFGGQRAVINSVSRTIFSVARFSGGCKIDGEHFIYNPMDDSLMREDVFKWLVNRKKQDSKQSLPKDEATLF